VPVYFVWILYLSFFRFGFEALVINEFYGKTIYCLENELVKGICPITNGSQVITELSMNAFNLWLDILVLVGFFISYRILGYLALRFLYKPK
jgi:ATP-binding cassette, subfamily G (WHITE), eye pigment precursor transporter